MGIEGEHRDPGFAHRKVSDQAAAQAAQRGQYLLLGHRTTHLFERDMDRYQSHFQQVAAHHHQRLAAELCGEEFGVTRKIESGLMHIFLADRRGHHPSIAPAFKSAAAAFSAAIEAFPASAVSCPGSMRNSPGVQSIRLTVWD